MTMNISKTKIDDKGRIQLPKHFLLANDIETGTSVIIQTVYNNNCACKLEFKKESKTGGNNERNNKRVTEGG